MEPKEWNVRKRDFSLKRNTSQLPPEKLMSILSSIEGPERAKETYRNLIADEVDEISETNRVYFNRWFIDKFGFNEGIYNDSEGNIIIRKEWLNEEYKKPEV